jgi:hypothetical protein
VALNDQLRQTALVAAHARGILRVICECADAECGQVVPITTGRFDQLRSSGEPVLAYGHTRSRAQTLVEKSMRVRADAEAMCAEARATIERVRSAWQTAKDDQLPFDLEGALVARLASVDYAVASLEATIVELSARHDMSAAEILALVVSALGLSRPDGAARTDDSLL